MPLVDTFVRGALPATMILAATLAAAAPLELHVAVTGDDGNDGRSAARPLATIAGARDRLRALRARGDLAQGATVIVHAGRYVLRETLTFTAEDSGTPAAPIVYRAAEGPVLLTGGPVITGWRPYQGEILQADLKALGMGGAQFEQLFFDGRRMPVARVPNVDPDDLHGGVWAHVVEAVPAGSKRSFVYARRELDAARWARPTDGYVGVFCNYDWRWNRIPIAGVDPEALRIDLARDTTYPLVVGDRFVVYNQFEELDAPGEWYLDRERSIVYFYPPGPIDQAEVTVPVVGDLVVLDGVSDLTLHGFVFEGCDGNAVRLRGASRCMVSKGVLRNCGGWGATIDGGEECVIAGCDITATGRGGVAVSGGDRKTLTPSRHLVTNCYIHHIAEFEKTYNTAINVGGVGNSATHNLIHDTPHAGLTLAGNDNIIEYNIIHHTNLQSTDTGGIYSCPRDWTQRGNIIRYNIWHDIGGYGKRSSWEPVRDGKVEFEYPHFTWGIYMDDPTSGNLIFGNILYRVPICALHNHGGRDNVFENNVIVDCPAFQAGMLDPNWVEWPAIYQRFRDVTGPGSPYFERYPALAEYAPDHPEAMTGLKFVRNIVYYTAAGTAWNRENRVWGCEPETMRLYALTLRAEDFAANEFDHNLIYAEPGIGLKIDLNRRPNPGERLSFEQWQALGVDQHSRIGDPHFVDPGAHDYRLREDSPALELGFQPIPVEQIGPFEDELRASWPIVEAPGASGRAKPIREYFQVPGMEPLPAMPFSRRGGAGNAFAKLVSGEPVRIAYYGGGIHPAGSGWRKLLADGIAERWPNAKVTWIDGSVCDCSRGSSFSAWRFRHDILAHDPDLVLVDFASDDSESPRQAEIQRAVEGVVRQAWRVTPRVDFLFLYAFRAGMESSYAEGLCPPAVTVYERVAERYQIPAVNLGFELAGMIQDGTMTARGEGDAAFSAEGVRPGQRANALYAEAVLRGFEQLAVDPQPGAHELPRPLAEDNYENVGLMAITPEMLSGDWRQLPADDPLVPRFSRHFDAIWRTDTPGAKLTFTFRGTDAGLYWLIGPDIGQVRVTVDGQDLGIRRQVDRWCYYHRQAALPLVSGLPDGEHTVTVELLPEPPDRSEPIAEAKRVNRYEPAAFEGVSIRVAWIRVRGESAGP